MARETKGWSQRELGRRLGVHHDFVSKCESGERQLNIVELRLWCRTLEISWTNFLAELDTAWAQQEQDTQSKSAEISAT